MGPSAILGSDQEHTDGSGIGAGRIANYKWAFRLCTKVRVTLSLCPLVNSTIYSPKGAVLAFRMCRRLISVERWICTK